MNQQISHRGPNASGIKLLENGCLGHVRLSVIDLSEAANQPFFDEEHILVFNGEVYNFEELRSKYKFQCQTKSDTEVIFKGLKLKGAEFLSELNGMFALAFWDINSKTLLVARDRLGIKPLYLYRNENYFSFSSEIKGLKSIQHELGSLTINHSSVNAFLHLGYIPKPQTIYNEIEKFPPGHFGFYEAGDFKLQPYWSANTSIEPNIIKNEKEAKIELDELLKSSIDYRLKSDVPFGTFLSGGIDSSTVSAIAQEVSPQKIKTFSIGFNNSDFDEAEFAKQVAVYIGSEHHEFIVTENDAKELVGDIITSYDEPFGDSSAIPTMLVSRLAKQEVTVTLSGDGGDELFHGYGFYNWAKRLSNPIIKSSRGLIGSALQRGGNRMKRASYLFEYPENQVKSHIFSQEQYYFTQNEIQDLLVNKTIYPSYMDKEQSFSRILSPKEKQSLFDINYYLRDDLLTKVDIASMKYSLETRVPLLDHRIVEFALNLDEKLKIKNGESKYLLKQVLYDYAPKGIFDRPKRGFSVPLKKWLQTDLKYLIDNNLNEETIVSVGLVKFIEVKNLLDRFELGEDYLFTRIWALIVLHQWIKQN
jgi:asparagine synthase (glutamine-hydrolysing)